jgi:hypothetical protein
LANKQTAGHHPCPKDDHGGQDDFPRVHSDCSATWSTAANTVLSIS